jgi:hypothetical protein
MQRNKEPKLRGIVLARQSVTQAMIFLMVRRMTKSAWFSLLGRKYNLRKAVRKKLTLPMNCRA